MKQLLTSFLLLVHLFNLFGYTYLFRYLEQHSNEQITTRIDQHRYNDSDLIELKVALNLPYLNSSNNYERHDGEVTINGRHHNYVKRKVSGDTLYLLCLPNTGKDELKIAAARFGTDTNNLADGSKKEMSIKKGVTFNQFQVNAPDYSLLPPNEFTQRGFRSLASTLPDHDPEISGRPPRPNC